MEEIGVIFWNFYLMGFFNFGFSCVNKEKSWWGCVGIESCCRGFGMIDIFGGVY